MHRREFLQQNLRLLALGLVPPSLLSACTSNSEKARKFGSVMAPSHFLAGDGKSTIFSFYDLDRDELYEMPIPLETPHTAVPHPRKHNLVFIPESGGTGACVVDVKERKTLMTMRAMGGRLFGGHCEFSPDGQLLFVSEFEAPPSGKGFLSVWKGDDFTPLRSFPTHGRFPHDVTVSRDTNVVTAANLGAEEGPHVKYGGIFVSRLDAKSGKLLNRVELNENAAEMNGSAIVAGDSVLSRDDAVIKTDARYFISYMEVARPQFDIFVYPHSHEPIVDIWGVKERRLIREIAFREQPVAIVLLHGRNQIAVALESGRLEFINVHSQQLDPTIKATKQIKVTTHICQWSGEPSSYG